MVILPEKNVLSFLDIRKGKLDALSITGGEPFLHEDLGDFAREVKKRGFLVKVDTNGTFPNRLEQLLDEHLIDYVSMDVKAPREKYDTLTGVKTDVGSIDRSIYIIKKKAPDYEFKTTMVPGLVEKDDVLEIATWIKGAKRYYLQQFKMDVPIIDDSVLNLAVPYEKADFDEMKETVSPLVERCLLRGV